MSASLKLSSLREQMAANQLSAYIIPSSDPHLSEYLPEHWKSRAWLSGFTGSAGTLVVTGDGAALWTDSRYFLQGEQELQGTGIELCKMGLPNTKTIEEWLAHHVPKGETVGFDGRLVTLSQGKTFVLELSKLGFKVDVDADLMAAVWRDRPQLPQGKAFEHKLQYSGVSASEKIGAIRNELQKVGANACILTMLDEVAWTFNIRGNDVEYNPVVLSYGYISQDEAILFINPEKLEEELAESLTLQGVTLMGYDEVESVIASAEADTVFAVDEARINHRLYMQIPEQVQKVKGVSIPTKLKAVKNAVEIENMRQSHIKDGVAMCQFLHQLEAEVGQGKVTELGISQMLKERRGVQQGFVSESFGTIAGYREHGAIVHYSASEQSSSAVKPEGFLLVDSGAQYVQGTTDITRTIHLGNPTQEEKEDYTLVLKGMIRLSMAHFPMGTRGSQLDILAREAMWNRGINYGHGTGHGIGAFLNVHEGPQSIRMNENPVTIEPGMVQSNEPGIYRAGKYGIRIENLILCREALETDSGKFLNFETLTLCPIDTTPIAVEMLNPDERSWLNGYHKMVFQKLSPVLNKELKDWLKEKTREI